MSTPGVSGTVLVTGASTGIGRACTERLAAAGAQVLAGARKAEDLEALGAIPGVEAVALDVTEPAAIAALGERLRGRALRGVVNNAGAAVPGPLEELPLDDLRRQFEVNTFACIAVVQATLPALRSGRGRIVNIGSIGGRVGQPFTGPYCGSKAALRIMSSSLRRELRPWGIWVTCIEPGTINTEIWAKGDTESAAAIEALSPDGRARYADRMQRMAKVLRRLDGNGLEPDAVAVRVQHALYARRPRAFDTIGRDAHAMGTLQALLPTRAWDRFMDRYLGL
jgi:NAD(P)-dependent dehydrogenase (short-subunit alcohol dehydrogenase family)